MTPTGARFQGLEIYLEDDPFSAERSKAKAVSFVKWLERQQKELEELREDRIELKMLKLKGR